MKRLRLLTKEFNHIPLSKKEKYEKIYEEQRRQAKELGLQAIRPEHMTRPNISEFKAKILYSSFCKEFNDPENSCNPFN